MKKVVIFQYRLLHYRTELFNQLRHNCANCGIDLHVVYGQASRREAAKKDEGSLPWGHKVANRFWEIGEHDWVWQPFPHELRDADLAIVMQENRILSNYPLLVSRLWSQRRLAYWGHGVNFQSQAPNGMKERWKRLMLNRVDWWFAYTSLTVDVLRQASYPSERITCLNNAIDNDGFSYHLANVSASRLHTMREQLNAPPNAPVGLFCGSLYPEKRLNFMIAAADKIHEALPAFRLVVIGDGPDAADICSAAETRPWLRWLGVRNGAEKAEWFSLADLIINPGLVGLHVLDSFCAGTPMVTTADAPHSPEIAYLRDGENCMVVRGGIDSYATAVIGLLSNRDRLERIKQAAIRDASRYTLKNMVDRFSDGIAQCVSMPKKC